MNKITFVSASDAKYVPMLKEWIHSIRRFPESKDFDISVFDVGMTHEQRESVRPLVTNLMAPEWPKSIPAHRLKGRDYIKACVNRPFMPELFPGYDVYFWMDSDTWLQDWRPVPLFLEGANRKKVALTTQSNRSYPKAVRIKWLGNWPLDIRGFYVSNARKAFSWETARKLTPFHVMQAGAFAIHKDAPHWKRWQELILQALEKGNPFTAEQLTLGMMIHLDGYQAEILPEWCHWLCEFKPLWDEERKLWVETHLPHEVLGIIHLSGKNKMRADRSVTEEFETLQGGRVEMGYRYPGFNGETDERMIG